jgi:hypothetical protein
VAALPIALALALLAAVPLTGCGSSGRAADATTVARDFQTALDNQDGGGACDRLSKQVAAKLAGDEQKPCDEAILGLDLPTDTDVARARVYVNSASVALPDGDTLFLDEAPSGWEISAGGCQPSEPGKPLDCDLED